MFHLLRHRIDCEKLHDAARSDFLRRAVEVFPDQIFHELRRGYPARVLELHEPQV